MGRGRKGIIDQSKKKAKTSKNQLRDQVTLFIPETLKENTEPPIDISEELLTQMKKMNPQCLKDALIPEVEEIYEFTDLEEFDLMGPEEPKYELPIPTRELCEQMMTTMSREQVRYIIEKSLAL